MVVVPTLMAIGMLPAGAADVGLHDDRLRYREPPYFLEPVAAAWRVVRQNEQVPARQPIQSGQPPATNESPKIGTRRSWSPGPVTSARRVDAARRAGRSRMPRARSRSCRASRAGR
jgi:hypothetical protein